MTNEEGLNRHGPFVFRERSRQPKDHADRTLSIASGPSPKCIPRIWGVSTGSLHCIRAQRRGAGYQAALHINREKHVAVIYSRQQRRFGRCQYRHRCPERARRDFQNRLRTAFRRGWTAADARWNRLEVDVAGKLPVTWAVVAGKAADGAERRGTRGPGGAWVAESDMVPHVEAVGFEDE
jgi:hypothetical protein